MTTARVRRQPRPRPLTVGALVRQGVRRFNAARLAFGHGTTNAFDEAAYYAPVNKDTELAPEVRDRTTASEEQQARKDALRELYTVESNDGVPENWLDFCREGTVQAPLPFPENWTPKPVPGPP